MHAGHSKPASSAPHNQYTSWGRMPVNEVHHHLCCVGTLMLQWTNCWMMHSQAHNKPMRGDLGVQAEHASARPPGTLESLMNWREQAAFCCLSCGTRHAQLRRHQLCNPLTCAALHLRHGPQHRLHGPLRQQHASLHLPELPAGVEEQQMQLVTFSI